MQYPVDFKEEHRSQGLCGVLAIAVAAGVTLADAHEACKRNLDADRKRHVRSTSVPQIEASVRDFGKETVLYDVERTTVRRWAESFGGRHAIVFTASHAMVYRDGLLCDQTEIAPAAQHDCKRRFVTQIMEII